MPEGVRLVGVLVGIVGLALGFRITVVVVAAGLVTGLAAGIPLLPAPGQEGFLGTLGRAFVDNRLMSLFIVTLPAIALAERYGLQGEAARWIHRMRGATVGRVLVVYQLFRVLVGVMGLRLGGHPTFVRPLIAPMVLGSNPAPAEDERVKAASAASENYGNFYGQNLSPVQAGILLVFGVMTGLGFKVDLMRLVAYTVPVVLASVVFAAVQFSLLDRRLRREADRGTPPEAPAEPPCVPGGATQ